jgi:hypothetical protein
MLSQTVQHSIIYVIYMFIFNVDKLYFFVLNFAFGSIVLLGFFFTFE